MVNANADALGIIFPNSYDEQVPDLVNERLMASIPFASRYRMVDFILSSMVNCGIGNVSIIVRKNYHSLMDHLGSGREWDLARKKGGLNIVPPYSEKKIQVYSGRVEALANVLDFLKWQKEKSGRHAEHSLRSGHWYSVWCFLLRSHHRSESFHQAVQR